MSNVVDFKSARAGLILKKAQQVAAQPKESTEPEATMTPMEMIRLLVQALVIHENPKLARQIYSDLFEYYRWDDYHGGSGAVETTEEVALSLLKIDREALIRWDEGE